MYKSLRTFIFSASILCCMIVLLAQCLFTYPVLAQDTKEDLVSMWRKGEYARVALKLIEYKKKEGGGLEIDYIIATSLCRIKEADKEKADRIHTQGEKLFELILKDYKNELDSEDIETVKAEMKLCKDPSKPSPRKMPAGVRGDPPSMN